MNVIAISAVISICLNGGPITLGACSDGSEPLKATVNILTGTAADDCWTIEKWLELHKCISKWDSILEIREGEKILFVLYPDGTVKAANGYKMDDAAKDFYSAVALLLDQKAFK